MKLMKLEVKQTIKKKYYLIMKLNYRKLIVKENN